ncbi:lipase, partial [Streptococcus sp. H49]
MVTDQNYNDISKEVYDLDPKKYPKYKDQVQIGDTIDSNGQDFKVIEAIGNSANPTSNGMQAMAVAPIVDGEPDTSQIVIAYA